MIPFLQLAKCSGWRRSFSLLSKFSQHLQLNEALFPSSVRRTLLTTTSSLQNTRQVTHGDQNNASDWLCTTCGFASNNSKLFSCVRCGQAKEGGHVNPSDFQQNDRGHFRSQRSSSYPDKRTPYSAFTANPSYASFSGRGAGFSLDNVDIAGPKGCWSEQRRGSLDQERRLFTAENTYNSGINFDKYEDIPVKVTGRDAPQSIEAYEDIELGKIVEDNIKICGHTKPTPVQKYAIPFIKANRDVMTCSQTGSGKTAAFLIPIISNICENGPFENSYVSKGWPQTAYPIGLILSPTRELASQIFKETRKLMYRSALRTAVLYGGAGYDKQLEALENGGHVIIATPGRLLDMIARKSVGLQSIRYLCVDEADRMLDMGFAPQLRQVVKENGMPSNLERQTSMFSATFPREIQKIAGEFLNDYLFVAVGRVGSTSENITQEIIRVGRSTNEKNACLLRIVRKVHTEDRSQRMLVFTNTKRGANDLANFLMDNQHQCETIHGDHRQPMRERALTNFKAGKCTVLIATDVAARGLDIPHVKYVINYDIPNDGIEAYVHRIGRTGRVGHIGVAISLFDDQSDGHIAQDLHDILVESKQDAPDWLKGLPPTRNVNTNYSGNNGRRFENDRFGNYGNRRPPVFGNRGRQSERFSRGSDRQRSDLYEDGDR